MAHIREQGFMYLKLKCFRLERCSNDIVFEPRGGDEVKHFNRKEIKGYDESKRVVMLNCKYILNIVNKYNNQHINFH